MVVSFFLTHLLLEVVSPIIFLPSPFCCHDLQEAKDSIDEEDPRPTISTWSYISLFCCVLWNFFCEIMIVACWTIFSWFSKEISGMVFVVCWVQLFPGENNCSQWVYLCDLTMILYQFALLETYSEIEVVVVLRVRTLKSVVYWPNGLW